MQRIDFYFDPSCPFCWITSRWLLQVSEQRDLEIAWRPFSLALKNDELGGGTDSPMKHSHLGGHRVLRVIAAGAKNGAQPIDLYSAFGRQHFLGERDYDDELIREVLREAGLSEDLARDADDETYDGALRQEMESALDVVGDDTGVPIIVFHTEHGKQGYFGPVLNELPGDDEALRLWDGLEKMATVGAFYELKRTRPSGGPAVETTQGH